MNFAKCDRATPVCVPGLANLATAHAMRIGWTLPYRRSPSHLTIEYLTSKLHASDKVAFAAFVLAYVLPVVHLVSAVL